MRKINRIALLFLVFLIKSATTTAQIDTSFWFAVPWVTPDHTNREDYVLHISTFNSPSTQVRLRQPAAIAPNKYDTIINIPANSVFNYVFWRDKMASVTNTGFDSLEVRPANTVVPYGLYISSTASITAVFEVVCAPPGWNNSETFSLKGQNGLGTEFVCPQQTLYRNRTIGNRANTPPQVDQPKQQIVIIATKPNTVVWIKPKANIVGHPANVTYSVMLTNAGDCYNLENTVQDTYIPGKNLSGTIITSDKPISVTVADDSVNSIFSNPAVYGPGAALGCYDLIGDQIVPVDIVGTDYIVNLGQLYKVNQPAAGSPGMKESAYIVATENNTQLTINDGTSTITALMNKGDTYVDTLFQNLTYINANKNVYVYHVSGYGCELGAAILPPLNCAGSKLVGFSRSSAQRFALNILCKNGSQSTFTLNASTTSVTAANFTMVPGTSALPGGPYWGAQVSFNSTAVLPIGSYTIGNNTDDFALGVFDGDFGSGGLYHYMSSFLRKTVVQTSTIAPVCVGVGGTVALTGTVSGGASTGVWTTNGSGTINPVYTSTLNTISTVYTLGQNDTIFPTPTSIIFTLTSTGNCTPKSFTTSVIVNPRPIVNIANNGLVMCKNNVVPIALTGSVTNAAGGLWTGGNGGSYGAPGPITTYTPSAADLAAGSITLTLSSQAPLSGCLNTSKSFTVGFNDPPVVNVISPLIACTNSQSVALTGTVTGSNLTYLWTTNGGGIFATGSNTLNAVYVFSAGDLTQPSVIFTLQAIDNSTVGTCAPQKGFITVNIQPAPTLSISTTPTICASNPIISLTGTVSGGGASAITWSTTNGTGAFTPQPPTGSNYNVSQNDTINGVVKFYATTSGGFCPSKSDTIIVSIIKLPLVTVNSNTSICQFGSVLLNGNVSGYTNQGSWTSNSIGGSTYSASVPTSGGFFPNNTSLGGVYYPSSGDLSAGSVTLTLSSASVSGISCPSAKRSFVISFVPSPEANFSFSTKRCIGDPVLFTNTSNTNSTTITGANWEFGNGLTSISIPSAQTTYTTAGIYLVNFTVTGTNSLNISCSDTISKRISINPLPIADFESSNACVGLTTKFTNLSIPANGTFSWFFGPAATPSVSSVQTPSNIVYNSPGPYNVDLRITSPVTQCTASVTHSVSVNPKPKAEFGMTNNPTVAQEPVYYSDFSTPTGNITDWFWKFGDEASATGSATTHNYQNGGIYVVTLTIRDNNDCTDTISKTIEVNLIPQVPTGFTPNSDGHNDRLFVKGGPFNKMIFRVYNNWGEKVYESDDQKEGWDGKKDGVDQPVGVYVWTLEVDLYNNRTVKKNGDITLMR